jgi:cytochrome P450
VCCASPLKFHGSLISMDDPRHGEIRRIVAKAFTPRVLEKLVGSVQAVADDVVARARRTAEDGDASIDVVADLAAPIPLRVVCDMWAFRTPTGRWCCRSPPSSCPAVTPS